MLKIGENLKSITGKLPSDSVRQNLSVFHVVSVDSTEASGK